MGDFNAKVGKSAYKNIVGSYGLGIKNERGERLIEFCEEYNLRIMNTHFKLPKRRLYTWKSPADTPTHPVRNQIDYITINQRYCNSITSTKTYPGADVPSDHVLLLSELKLKFKKNKPKQTNRGIEPGKVKDFKQILEEECHNKKQSIKQLPLEDKWTALRDMIHDGVLKKIKRSTKKNKPWMTDKIMTLLEERRKYKNKNSEKYKLINKQIKKEVKVAKESWISEQCKEIENLQGKHDSFNLHKKIKEFTGLFHKNNNCVSNLTDDDGNIMINVEDKMKTWKRYIEELFNDNRPDLNEENINSTVTPITIREIENVIRTSKNRKANGPDDIPMEIFKILEEQGKEILKDLFDEIYKTGKFPEEWLHSIFVTLPKKTHPKSCKDYRTISLMCHALKLFLKIIQQRTFAKIEENIGSTQFGFRNGMGTREALFCLQILVQRCRDLSKDVFICFIDFEKAFDKIHHVKLIEVLKKINIDDTDIRIIKNLYWQQSASVRVEGQITEPISIKRGVRQGCVLSPQLFNIYSEYIFKESIEEQEFCNIGIEIDETKINNIRYADDTVLFASSMEDLQKLVNKITSKCEAYGLRLNTSKTKYMIITKQKKKIPRIPKLKAYNVQLERTESIIYLGSNINDDWDPSKEIRIRIEKARSSFIKLKKFFCGQDINMELKIRMLRCYVFSVLLYGVESWTITDTVLKKVEAFEMWTYRRILKIKWTDRITNEEVLRRMSKNKEIAFTIKKRKLQYFGHIVRNPVKYHQLLTVLQGEIAGKRKRGRPRTSWIQNLSQWFNKSMPDLLQAAHDKNELAIMIANVL
ncbi:hypothetical protein M8J77_012531 [Diaphorina citri]|nr:hypothetical protein M8J77_012531 [Diaphorina citri]